MQRYFRYESWLVRWAFLLDNLFNVGIMQRVPLWEFWLRATVVTPLIVIVAGIILFHVGLFAWRYPKVMLVVFLIVWFIVAWIGFMMMLSDRTLVKKKMEDVRDFVNFE